MPNGFVDAAESAAAAALLEEVSQIAATVAPAYVENLFTPEVAARLGVTSREPVLEAVSNENGKRVVHCRAYVEGLLAAAGGAAVTATQSDEDGDHEEADDLRELALLLCRDALRGELSDEVECENGCTISIPLVNAMTPEEYDAECRKSGNVELFEWAKFRPVRRFHTEGAAPGRLPAVNRRLPRTRRRERRSRRNARGSPGAKPRREDPDRVEPLGAAA